jgi:radical SAM superfamily enzyme YgiQ (UPF0313 family)
VDGSGAPFQLPNFGLRRIHAEIIAHPELGAEVAIVELETRSVDAYVEQIVAGEPHVVGLAAYVWSFPIFVEVAGRLRELLPEATIVMGGPSARPAMFELSPYRHARSFVDALVPGEGEMVFLDLLRSDRRRETLASLPGLSVPTQDAFHVTPREPLAVLDPLASPYQLGLMPRGGVGYLETYRGCALSCTFCEWGLWAGGRFGEAALVAELEALAEAQANPCFLLDSGLNLNARAFRGLLRAEEQVGYFKNAELIAELYPSRVNDDVLRFLDGCKVSYLGVGLQSLDPAVLARHQRPFQEKRFAEVVSAVATRASVEVQIILGLPGDSPEGFRRTVEHVRGLPVDARVYRCLVLPDALMTRAPPDFAMDYDPRTLHMRSCLGWTSDELDRATDWLASLARDTNGVAGEYWWYLPGPHRSGGHVDHVNRSHGLQASEQRDGLVHRRGLPIVD